jgi:hypothetical protein
MEHARLEWGEKQAAREVLFAKKASGASFTWLIFRRSRSNAASNGDAKENGSKNGKEVAAKAVTKEALKQKENKKKGLKRL